MLARTSETLPPSLAQTFHQVGPENELRTDAHWVCRKLAVGTTWFSGLHGRSRAPCGHAAPALRATRLGYWLGARCTACVANRLAIIP
jgi:ribosome modulation factor